MFLGTLSRLLIFLDSLFFLNSPFRGRFVPAPSLRVLPQETSQAMRECNKNIVANWSLGESHRFLGFIDRRLCGDFRRALVKLLQTSLYLLNSLWVATLGALFFLLFSLEELLQVHHLLLVHLVPIPLLEMPTGVLGMRQSFLRSNETNQNVLRIFAAMRGISDEMSKLPPRPSLERL